MSAIGEVDLNKALQTSSMGAFQYVTDKDGVIKAMIVNKDFTTAKESNTFYGVINSFTSVMSGTTQVQKLSGLNGATSKFEYLTDGTAVLDGTEDDAGDVVKFKLSSDGKTLIEVSALSTTFNSANKYSQGIIKNVTVAAVNTDRTVLTATTTTGVKYTVAADALVYKMTVNTDNTFSYEVGSLTNINVADTIWLYDTKGTDVNGTATVVVYKAH